jgi:hypothetical protein
MIIQQVLIFILDKKRTYKNLFYRIWHEYIIHPRALFLYGFLYEFSKLHKNEAAIDRPLSNLFNHAIDGMFLGIGAVLVSGFVPSGLEVSVLLALISSRILQELKEK